MTTSLRKTGMNSNHSPEECKSIFVEWKWVIGLLSAALLTIGSLAWAGSSIVSKNSEDHAKYEQSLTGVEKNSAKLDTLIEMMRAR